MKIDMNQVTDQAAAEGAKPEKPKKAKPKAAPKPEASNSKAASKDGLKGLMRQNKFWIAICIVLFVVFLSVNSNMNNIKTELTIRLRNIESDTASLKGAISEVEADLEEQEKIKANMLSDEEKEAAYEDAVEKGELVAELQNKYKEMNASDNQDEYEANVEALDKCFDEDGKEFRVRWYSDDEAIPGTWQFESKAAFSGKNTKVLWLCYADDGSTLLAYCTAVYNADTKLFSKVDKKLTRYAEANIGTDDGAAANTNDMNSMVGSLKTLVEDGTLEAGDEEVTDETIEQSNEMSQSRESLKSAVEGGEIEGDNYDPRYETGLDSSSPYDEEGGDDNETISE